MKYTVAIQLLILSVACLHARPLTLEECKIKARANYPAIRQYELVEKIKENTFSTILLYWLPNVTIGAQATIQNKVPEFPTEISNALSAAGLYMPGLRKEQYKAYIEAVQPVWDGGKKKAFETATLAEAQEAKAGIDVEMHALNGRIEDIYFSVLLLDNGITQTENKISLLKGSYEKLQAYVNNGVALPSDADAIEAEILSAKQGCEKLRSAKKAYKRVLEIFLGEGLDEADFLLPPTLPAPALVSYRPELLYLDSGIDKLNAKEKQVKAGTRPEIGIFAQAYYGYPSLDYFQGMRSSSPSLNAIAGVRFSWNISALTRKKTEIEGLGLAKKRLELQKSIFVFNNMLEAESKNQELEHLKNLLQDDDKIVELRRNVRAAAESKLKNGIIDISDLSAKITAENEALINRNSHEIQLIKAIYELRHSINQADNNEN